MKAIFTRISLKNYVLSGGVGGLCLYLFSDPGGYYESLSNAGFYVSFWYVVLWWTAAPTYIVMLSIYFSPTIADKIVTTLRSLPPFALPSGEETKPLPPALSIGSDILIRYDSESETPQEFSKKGIRALHIENRKAWILFALKGERVWVYVMAGGTEVELDRNKLPWQADGWEENRTYENETFQEYEADLAKICHGWNGWSLLEKTRCANKGTKVVTLLEEIAARSFAVLLLCLFSFVAYAQPKSEQVRTFLGEKRASLKPTGPVVYRFAQLEMERMGDGQKNMIELLQAGRMYTDADNAGLLLGISVTIKDKLIALTPMPQEAKPKGPTKEDLQTKFPETKSRDDMRKFIRPNQARDTTKAPETAPDIDRGSLEWIDSTKMANTLNQSRAEIMKSKNKLWGLAMAAWETVLWWVDLFYYVLLYAVGITRFVAVMCNNETRINAYGSRIYGGWYGEIGAFFSFVTGIIMGALVVLLLTNAYLRMATGNALSIIWIFLGWNAWFAYCWLAILWAANRFMDKWIPNPKVAKNNETGVAKRS